jgi:hypothetical protein
VTDAEVRLFVDGRHVAYRSDAAHPGQYTAHDSPGDRLESRAAFSVDVRWNGLLATAAGIVPPPIVIDSVEVDYDDRPVQAVFADSLSPNLREGFLYPVEVTVWWTIPFAEVDVDSSYWVRARLKPPASFPSAVVDFFLRTEQIVRERLIESDAGRKKWVGVYGVPVESDTSPMPPHSVEVALLRSTEDYARYASSRSTPARREPVSNVAGGIGIVAGIAQDRTTLRIDDD